jgi:hypothetical protein
MSKKDKTKKQFDYENEEQKSKMAFETESDLII